MAGFLDVLLRGLILVFASLVLGGVAWTRLVLRAEPHVKPSPATTLALRGVAVAAAAAALGQTCTLLVALAGRTCAPVSCAIRPSGGGLPERSRKPHSAGGQRP